MRSVYIGGCIRGPYDGPIRGGPRDVCFPRPVDPFYWRRFWKILVTLILVFRSIKLVLAITVYLYNLKF